ncbi:toll/interleukin-1 receptor domain-containing protein [Bacillus sp. AF23]|uniref:toll/interleukin-1 receptor domain-containing protein n=1 Tax=Bacillus sp. AF23 TaxID=2821151 RepID=UPI001E2A49FF|nr:toll/interleukin-1 receptor domain-containing protein [Bacillus sp. AF23]MCC8351588.1 toll/interleukin-1 receptor domain-containing protein [Bacillus sp. AF23]
MKKDVKVFISYSWTNDSLVDWVREDIATRLMEDGVDVVLDQWDLKEGQDVFAFMESMVNDSSIDKVLVICDQGYKNKADSRAGGVGTETQIITPKVYSEATQEKFIPIIAERDENGNDFIPTYMDGRKYIDLSSEELYIENYEQLLRVIYERPLNRKPKKGAPPAYIFEDEQINDFKFNFTLKQIENDLKKGKLQQINAKVSEFKREFITALEEFRVEKKGENVNDLAQEIEDRIDNMESLKNDFIELIELLSSNEILSVNFLIEFFEGLHNEMIKIRNSVQGGFYEIQFDHYKFLITEIFVSTVMVLLRGSNFQLLSEFLYSRFFIYRDFVSNGKESVGFEVFNHYIQALNDIQVKKADANYVNYSSKKMIRRLPKNYTQTDFADTDILLYYISCFKKDENEYIREWFPFSYIYANGKIEILQKMESFRHFERVKCLFEVYNKDEFIKLANNFKNPSQSGYRGLFDSIPHIKKHINLDSICKFR